MPLLGFLSKKKPRNNSTDDANVKANATSLSGNTSVSSHDEATSTYTTSEYIPAKTSLPSSSNGRSSVYPSIAASSSKLRLPFRRKRFNAADSTTSLATTSNVGQGSYTLSPPRPSFVSRTSTSESDASDRTYPRPPPSKSAFFVAYGEQYNAYSTQSLPPERTDSLLSSRTEPPSPPPPLPPPKNGKKTGFFPWSRSSNASSPSPSSNLNSKSNPATTTSRPELTPLPPISSSSFNLKSFRHVRQPSPTPAPQSELSRKALTSPSATSLLPPPRPRPRPRGDSTTSDSSQRISVAAFREAQARRSLAGSPVPSFRDDNPGPPIPPLPLPRNHASKSGGDDTSRITSQYANVSTRVSKSNTGHGSNVRQEQAAHKSTKRPSPASRSQSHFHSSSDESLSSSDDSSDSAGNSNQALGRRRTITQRSLSGPLNKEMEKPIGKKAKSELGHGVPASQRPGPPITNLNFNGGLQLRSSTFDSFGLTSSNRPSAAADVAPRSQSSLGLYGSGSSRARVSVSTSALTPNAAAKRASIIVSANARDALQPPRSHHVRETSTSSQPTVTRNSKSQYSSSSSSDSDDDAPLSTLVPPRRPGSGMSNLSSSSTTTKKSNVNSSNSARKPLIDIAALTSSKPSTGGERDKESGFTPGATLLGGVVTSKSPPTEKKFISPPPSPRLRNPGSGSRVSPVLKSARGSPVVKSAVADVSPLQTSAHIDLGEKEERRRDLLEERLSKAVVNAVGRKDGGEKSGDEGRQNELPSVNSRKPNDAEMSAFPKVDSWFSVDENEGKDSMEVGSGGDGDSDDGGISGKEKKNDHIAPIPIKERIPPSAFSVTSRPQHKRIIVEGGTVGGRQRSSTLITPSTSGGLSTDREVHRGRPGFSPSPDADSGSKPNSNLINLSPTSTSNTNSRSTSTPNIPNEPKVRQRSSTLISFTPVQPSKPFAMARRESPASSTGDSSSGRAPLTPGDGSDLGASGVSGWSREERDKARDRGRDEDWSGGASGLGLGKGKHVKRKSVSFDEDEMEFVNGGGSKVKDKQTPEGEESRRRERRRTEARAAIELGNVINGRGPIVDDDDDLDDIPMNQALGGRMGEMINPMMNGNMGNMGFPGLASNNWNAWQQQASAAMLAPRQFMVPQPADPSFLAAHQQAMMIAKQAYQMAVAQQAMAAAGEEWERGSSVGGFNGGRGSVYGGTSPSIFSGMNSGMGMNMNMGMGMGGNGWSTGSVMMSPGGGARSMYGSGARSEYGGGSSGGPKWSSSKSVYGESFGPSPDRSRGPPSARPGFGQRESGYFSGPVPPLPNNDSAHSERGGARARARTTSTPAAPGSSPARGLRKAPPPSSWKATRD